MVNFHPHFTLVFVQMCIMSELVHAIYGGNNLHTHVSLQYAPIPGRSATRSSQNQEPQLVAPATAAARVPQVAGASIQLKGSIRRSLASDAFPCQPQLACGHDSSSPPNNFIASVSD